MLKKYISTLAYYNLRRSLSFRITDKLDWAEQAQIIMEPFEYIQKVPSKHHKLMVSAFNHWLQAPKEKVEDIEETLQALHTWSLMLDDIQDGSESRYGIPAAHHVYSMGLTVNAASNALVTVEKKILGLGHPSALKIFLDRVEEMHQGQGIDLYWRDHFICPTEAQHIEMLKKKAASFFVLLVELLQLFSSDKRDFTSLAMNIGVFYPILDDYYNLFHPQALERFARDKQGSGDHTICSDVTECKITLAVIHAMQFSDVASELGDILKQQTKDPKQQNRAIALLKKHESDKYTRDALKQLEDMIRLEIDRLGGNAILTRFMDDLNFKKLGPEQD